MHPFWKTWFKHIQSVAFPKHFFFFYFPFPLLDSSYSFLFLFLLLAIFPFTHFSFFLDPSTKAEVRSILSFSAPSCVNFNHFFTSIRNLHIVCAHHHFLVLLFFKFSFIQVFIANLVLMFLKFLSSIIKSWTDASSCFILGGLLRCSTFELQQTLQSFGQKAFTSVIESFSGSANIFYFLF